MAQQDIITPKVFLGCYVKRMSSTLGFNSDPSTVELDLVAGDPNNAYDMSVGASGFNESQVLPGNFYKFNWGAFKFVGMVQSWNHSFSAGGEIYSVRLVDPRQVFNSIPVTLNGFGFSTGIQLENYLNVFQYYGNPANADSTEYGITFNKVKTYLESTGIINLYGTKFICSFGSGYMPESGLIINSGIPTWYRLNSQIMSLDQIISQTSSDMNMDWYAQVDYDSFNPTGLNTIRIVDIPRYTAISGLNILMFISGTRASGTQISFKHGQELRSDPVNVVVQGAQATRWLTPATNQIKNYWGRSDQGTVLTTDYNDTRGFVLLDNIRVSGAQALEPFTVNVPIIYVTKATNANVYPPQWSKTITTMDVTGYRPSVNTMRAALYSQKAFEAMLYIDHLPLAQAIGIRSHPVLDGSQYVGVSEKMKFAAKLSVINSGTVYVTQAQKALIQAVYEATKSTVDQYWGKGWLVQLPSSQWLIEGSYDNSELFPRLEYATTDAAWGENVAYPSGITNHPVLLGSTSSLFKDDIGKTKAFLSLNNIGQAYSNNFPYYIDVSRNTRECLVEQGNKLILPINIEQYNLSPDQAIITIANPIEGISVSGYYGYENQKEYFDFLRAVGYSDANITGYFLQLNTYDHAEYGLERPRIFQMESVAGNYGIHIPLVSNVSTFGPFYATGLCHGPLNVIKDESLAPWSFGSYAKMNLAGQQLARRASSSIYIMDFGEVSVAGVPEFNIGDRIGDNANMTSISIQMGQDGLTTNYSLKTFALPAGRLTKLITDRITKIYNEVQYAKRDLIEIKQEKDVERLTSPKRIEEASDSGAGMIFSFLPNG